MRWLYALCAITINFVCTLQANCIGQSCTLDDYFYSCLKELPDGIIDIYYVSADPYAYDHLISFEVSQKRKLNFRSKEETFKTDILMIVGCTCTNIPLNSHKYIVMPMMLKGLMSDALTLCIFRGNDKTVMDVMDLPTDSLEHYMIAQYMVQMPRSLVDYTLNDKHDCINKNGQPSSAIPGQKMCYYYNYVLYEQTDNYFDKHEERSDFGPFLGSQLPVFERLADLVSEKDVLSFAMNHYLYMCAVLKMENRVLPNVGTGCVYREYTKNETYVLEIATCCCNSRNDGECSTPIKSTQNGETYCSDGNQDKKGGRFGAFCAATVNQVYNVPNKENFELLTANRDKTKEAKFFNATVFAPSVEIQCAGDNVIVSQTLYCNGTAFCNSHLGRNLLNARCHYSFALDFKTNGCPVVFYYETGKMHVVSPAWFDMGLSETVYLFTYEHEGFSDDVSAGFLFFHNVSDNCKSKAPRFDREYYVLYCEYTNCDANYTESFFNSKEFLTTYELVNRVNFPLCENGSIELYTTDSSLTKLDVRPKTNLLFALYCDLWVTLDYYQQNFYITMIFTARYPRPPDCNEQMTQFGNYPVYHCCYAAKRKKSYINPECHYSTALKQIELLHQMEIKKSKQNMANIGVYENADDCEQRRIGQFGNYRQCTPGGVGCFHLLKTDLTKKDVVASCIGQAENLIASKEEYYDNFGEALVCRTPESRDSCQYVYEGGNLYLLCCCQSEDVHDGVAHCAQDSKMMFHESDHPLKKVGHFIDGYEKDEKH